MYIYTSLYIPDFTYMYIYVHIHTDFKTVDVNMHHTN